MLSLCCLWLWLKARSPITSFRDLVIDTMQRKQTWHCAGAPNNDRELPKLVMRAIAASLAKGNPTIVQTAEVLGLSVRSLQRRLLQLDLTHRQLLDEVRLEAARHLLERSEKSLAQIAADLGYADPANFTRAFQRWTGQSPSAYRRRRRSLSRCR